MRTSTLLALMWLSGCRTVAAGVVERADALLADYRNRTPPTWEAPADSAPPPWAPGQFTVYSRASEGRVVLERVALRRGRGDDVRVAVDRLGGGEQLRVHLTLARQPAGREELAALVLEAWVTRGEGPEIHTLGAAPADVLSLAADLLISPPQDSASETIVVPAGRFEGCVGGAHALVPISGVVRQRPGGDLRELLEFGDDNGGALF
ncbi:MAG: hypothetical protein Q8L14_23110 [Myxococcales bacterium]|nr:hypothetical protein [Myxococcales bacterium]